MTFFLETGSVLTGSQHFLQMRDVSQSLAGRTVILRLLPLEWEEIRETHGGLDANALMRRGFYPRLYEREKDPYGFCTGIIFRRTLNGM